jgi:hypothetical protein
MSYKKMSDEEVKEQVLAALDYLRNIIEGLDNDEEQSEEAKKSTDDRDLYGRKQIKKNIERDMAGRSK